MHDAVGGVLLVEANNRDRAVWINRVGIVGFALVGDHDEVAVLRKSNAVGEGSCLEGSNKRCDRRWSGHRVERYCSILSLVRGIGQGNGYESRIYGHALGGSSKSDRSAQNGSARISQVYGQKISPSTHYVKHLVYRIVIAYFSARHGQSSD